MLPCACQDKFISGSGSLIVWLFSSPLGFCHALQSWWICSLVPPIMCSSSLATAGRKCVLAHICTQGQMLVWGFGCFLVTEVDFCEIGVGLMSTKQGQGGCRTTQQSQVGLWLWSVPRGVFAYTDMQWSLLRVNLLLWRFPSSFPSGRPGNIEVPSKPLLWHLQ